METAGIIMKELAGMFRNSDAKLERLQQQQLLEDQDYRSVPEAASAVL